MTTRRSRCLGPLTAAAAVALTGLSVTSATAADLPERLPATTRGRDPAASPGQSSIREHTVYDGYGSPGKKVVCMRKYNHCTPCTSEAARCRSRAARARYDPKETA